MFMFINKSVAFYLFVVVVLRHFCVFFCCILLYSILKINYFADVTVMAAIADNRPDFYAFITPAIYFETHSL